MQTCMPRRSSFFTAMALPSARTPRYTCAGPSACPAAVMGQRASGSAAG